MRGVEGAGGEVKAEGQATPAGLLGRADSAAQTDLRKQHDNKTLKPLGSEENLAAPLGRCKDRT